MSDSLAPEPAKGNGQHVHCPRCQSRAQQVVAEFRAYGYAVWFELCLACERPYVIVSEIETRRVELHPAETINPDR